MNTLIARWWLVAAGLIAIALATFGIGTLLEDDGGPLYGRIVAASVAVALALLIIAGLIVRTRNQARGSNMIAIGVLPGTVLTVLFWFPPVALTGLLSIVVAWHAFQDAIKHRGALHPTSAT